MRSKDIKKMRMDVGRFLHEYYIKFGEQKYENFINKLGESMITQYGEPFSSDNLRIMEAEYVTFNRQIDEKKNRKTAK